MFAKCKFLPVPTIKQKFHIEMLELENGTYKVVWAYRIISSNNIN